MKIESDLSGVLTNSTPQPLSKKGRYQEMRIVTGLNMRKVIGKLIQVYLKKFINIEMCYVYYYIYI